MTDTPQEILDYDPDSGDRADAQEARLNERMSASLGHTPGPWTVDEINTSNGVSCQISHLWEGTDEETGEPATHTDEIAQVAMDYRGDRALCNARLMAAGPEMLRALRQAANCLNIHNLNNAEDAGGWGQGPDGWQGSIGDVLHQAIAKAEGSIE